VSTLEAALLRSQVQAKDKGRGEGAEPALTTLPGGGLRARHQPRQEA